MRDRDDKLADARAEPGLVDQAAAAQIKRARGQRAPAACLQAVRASFELPFEDGLALETQLFVDLVNSPESRAQRHAFFAEREALKVPGVPAGLKASPVERAVLIGAGTMGGGIAMCFANVGIPVTLTVVTRFGFPMGPYAMGDLAGLDVGWRIRQGKGIRAPISDALCEQGRLGQQTGAGYYRYEGRTRSPDPEVELLRLMQGMFGAFVAEAVPGSLAGMASWDDRNMPETALAALAA